MSISIDSASISSPRRPILAYLSPLPPERSGISDFSAELLPQLSRHYDIEVVAEQNFISDAWVKANCTIRSVTWFRAHAKRYDRVLYHFGNSPFHQHMFGLLEEVPGIVVLHDFFLAHVISNMEATKYQPGAWSKALYQSHGYTALQQWFHSSELENAIMRYPCNMGVLEKALGVIVHSEYSRRLAIQWYGEGVTDHWAVVPLLRVPSVDLDRAEARRKLNLGKDDFVVCSFGMLGPTKLNHRLLEAWRASTLAQCNNCVLIFVGENDNGEYGTELLTMVSESGLSERISITGWADAATFRHYLAAADMAVQLRTLSRGETSAAVLDCMNYALPTIVNTNGSMVDLPDEGVWKLPDEFSNGELITALEALKQDSARRQQLGENAREIIRTRHAPRHCAAQYAEAIESIYQTELSPVAAESDKVTKPIPASSDAWAVVQQLQIETHQRVLATRKHVRALEVRTQQAEAREHQTEARAQQTEIRAQQTEIRAQQTEIRAQQTEIRAQQTEIRAQQTEIRAQRAETNATKQEQRAISAEQRVTNILSSTSWRITAPIRMISKTAKSFYRALASDAETSKSKLLLAHAELYIRRHPSVKRVVLVILQPFPSLKERLTRAKLVVSTTSSVQVAVAKEFKDMTPRARLIYLELKEAIENHSKGIR